MNNELMIIVGMALVTYIPRMIPFVVLKDIKIPKKVDRFLSFIPFTMLSALIFPDILSSTGNLNTAIIGMIVCFLAAMIKLKPTFVVIIGVLFVFISQMVLA